MQKERNEKLKMKNDLPNEITDFMINLRNGYNGDVTICHPTKHDDEWWIELKCDVTASVVWRKNLGFGMFNCYPIAQGEQPGNIFQNPIEAANRVCSLMSRKKIIKGMEEAGHGAIPIPYIQPSEKTKWFSGTKDDILILFYSFVIGAFIAFLIFSFLLSWLGV